MLSSGKPGVGFALGCVRELLGGKCGLLRGLARLRFPLQIVVPLFDGLNQLFHLGARGGLWWLSRRLRKRRNMMLERERRDRS